MNVTHLRARCIRRWGAACCVCGFDFALKYGSIGEGYIHVHHLRPLSEIGEEYLLNPEEDLRPVCANWLIWGYIWPQVVRLTYMATYDGLYSAISGVFSK
jgi:hypothetical protein